MTKENGISHHLSGEDVDPKTGLGQDTAIGKQREPMDPALEKRWNEQAQTLARLFAKPLGLSEEKYIARLPDFIPKREEYKGRLHIPVLVQPPVPRRGLGLDKMCGILKIRYDPWFETFKDWEEDPQGFVTPKAPYATWVRSRLSPAYYTPETIRAELAPDERAGTIYDGLALLIHGKVRKNSSRIAAPNLELAGTQESTGTAVYIEDVIRFSEPRGFTFRTRRAHEWNRGGSIVVASREIATKSK